MRSVCTADLHVTAINIKTLKIAQKCFMAILLRQQQ
jgi:hypothetical protein